MCRKRHEYAKCFILLKGQIMTVSFLILIIYSFEIDCIYQFILIDYICFWYWYSLILRLTGKTAYVSFKLLELKHVNKYMDCVSKDWKGTNKQTARRRTRGGISVMLRVSKAPHEGERGRAKLCFGIAPDLRHYVREITQISSVICARAFFCKGRLKDACFSPFSFLGPPIPPTYAPVFL